MAGHGTPDTFRQCIAVLFIARIDDHSKLLSPHAGHHPVFANDLLNLAGKGCQHAVAALMTVVIIDAFEVINIEQHDGQKTWMTVRFFAF